MNEPNCGSDKGAVVLKSLRRPWIQSEVKMKLNVVIGREPNEETSFTTIEHASGTTCPATSPSSPATNIARRTAAADCDHAGKSSASRDRANSSFEPGSKQHSKQRRRRRQRPKNNPLTQPIDPVDTKAPGQAPKLKRKDTLPTWPERKHNVSTMVNAHFKQNGKNVQEAMRSVDQQRQQILEVELYSDDRALAWSSAFNYEEHSPM